MNRVKGGCKTPSERPFSCRGWPLYNFLFLFICLSNLSHANKFRYSFSRTYWPTWPCFLVVWSLKLSYITLNFSPFHLLTWILDPYFSFLILCFFIVSTSDFVSERN